MANNPPSLRTDLYSELLTQSGQTKWRLNAIGDITTVNVTPESNNNVLVAMPAMKATIVSSNYSKYTDSYINIDTTLYAGGEDITSVSYASGKIASATKGSTYNVPCTSPSSGYISLDPSIFEDVFVNKTERFRSYRLVRTESFYIRSNTGSSYPNSEKIQFDTDNWWVYGSNYRNPDQQPAWPFDGGQESDDMGFYIGGFWLDVPPAATIGRLVSTSGNDYYKDVTTVSISISDAIAYYGGDFVSANAGIKFEVGSQSVSMEDIAFITEDTVVNSSKTYYKLWNNVYNEAWTWSGMNPHDAGLYEIIDNPSGMLSINLNSTGTFTPKVTLTDSRGQIYVETLDPITVIEYKPTANILNLQRINATGEPEDDPDPEKPSDEGTNAVIACVFDYPDFANNYMKSPLVKFNNISTNNVDWYLDWSSDNGFSGEPINFDEYDTSEYSGIILKDKNVFAHTNDTTALVDREYYQLNVFKPENIIGIGYLDGTAVLNGDGSITVNGHSTHSDYYEDFPYYEIDPVGNIRIYLDNITLPYSYEVKDGDFPYMDVDNLDLQPNYDDTTIGSAHLKLIQYNEKDVKSGGDIFTDVRTHKYYINSKYRLGPYGQASCVLILIDGEAIDFSRGGSNQYSIELDIDSYPSTSAVVEMYYRVNDIQLSENKYITCLSINYSGEFSDEIFYPRIIADSNTWDSYFSTGHEQFIKMMGDLSEDNPAEEGWYEKLKHFEPPITLYGWIKNTLNTNTSYEISVACDTALAPGSYDFKILPQAFYLLSAPEGGHGLGIGRKVPADAEGRGLHVGMDTTFYENVYAPNLPGIIKMFAGAVAPTGWLLCDGSEVAINDYPALYEVIQNTYGTASDSDHFILPDFRGRMPVGVGNGTATGHTDHTLGQKNGNENAIIVTHSHKIGANDGSRQFVTRSNNSSGVGESRAASGTAFYAPSINSADNWWGTENTQAATGGESGTGKNMPPYLAINYIISTGERTGWVNSYGQIDVVHKVPIFTITTGTVTGDAYIFGKVVFLSLLIINSSSVGNNAIVCKATISGMPLPLADVRGTARSSGSPLIGCLSTDGVLEVSNQGSAVTVSGSRVTFTYIAST